MNEKGLVLKSTGSFYRVKLENGKICDCTLKGKFRTLKIRSTNPIAVGDKVLVSADDNTVITKILPRKNHLIRKATNLSKESHIIAANIDQAFLIVSLSSPTTSPMFIDRFLVTAEAYRIPVTIVFNKIDLLDSTEQKDELDKLVQLYEQIGYQCIKTSAKNNINIDTFRELLSGKVSVVSGQSGVGKSTLMNAIDSQWQVKVGKISDSHQSGKHTTTFAEMYELENDGYIIDTPGVRSFGLVDIEKKELSHFFREIFAHSENCKFNNCTHLHEPGCGVIGAVKNGEIALSRYENYLSILLDEDTKHRI